MSAPTEVDRAELPVQHGWRLLSDGMHIHRWFLHCHQPADEPTEQWPLTGAVVRLCGAPVAIVYEADCDRDADGRIVVAPSLVRTGRPAVTAEFVEQVNRLIEWAELGYLCRLATRTVMVSSGDVGDPGGDLVAADSPVTFAEHLVAGAAVQWLRRFLVNAPEARRGHRPSAATVEVAALGVRTGAACRLLEALRTYPDLRPGQADLVQRRYQHHDAEAKRCRDQVYRAVETLPLMAADLVTTLFPGPARFAKYENGGGVGQSE